MLEFFPFKKTIPFMSWGKVTTAISLATFLFSIWALWDKGLNLGVDFTGGTLIAGIALFWLGSGPVRGFAVVLCLGILTSMFSAVTVSRAMVNLTYGRQPRLTNVSI